MKERAPIPVVLYLLDYAELGGGETGFLALAGELLRGEAGVRPVVVLPRTGPVAERLAALGVDTHIVPYPCLLRHGPLPWYSIPAARMLGQLIDKIRPALIHAHNFFGMLYAGPAARRRGIPLVWTCHGWFDIDSWIKVRAARRFTAHVSCVSEAVRQDAAARLGAAPPTSTDYLGIAPFDATADGAERMDRDAIRAEFGVKGGEALIAVLGRFQPIKGHGVLLDALPAIRRRIPQLKVWFIGDAIAGSAEERDEKQMIEWRVKAEGLDSCVRFLGFRTDAPPPLARPRCPGHPLPARVIQYGRGGRTGSRDPGDRPRWLGTEGNNRIPPHRPAFPAG